MKIVVGAVAAVWEGGNQGKMVICANLMWKLYRTVFTISYYGRKLEQCIENEKFYFSLSFPRWSAVQSTLSKETVGFLGSEHMIFSLVHDDLGHLVPILMIMSPWNHAKKSICHFFFFFWIKNMHKVIFQKNNVFLA